ncbi:hypothetical protein [Sulfuriflexus mobilis]|uniref:hypothetical protein n=1 Tax=Sulfuriflexus mobilis TaxID=1811807 RepID=UPI000F846528|nr:hypothetical protein [Sulfuriflexus mobilis]
METILAIIILLDAYAIIFYRLMVKHYYEKENNTKESNFGAIFSLPPHSKLSDKGKHYSKRYWLAIGVLAICIALLIPGRDFSALTNSFNSAAS